MPPINVEELEAWLFAELRLDPRTERNVTQSLDLQLRAIAPALPEAEAWYAATAGPRTAEAHLLASKALVTVRMVAAEDGPRHSVTFSATPFRDLFPVALHLDGLVSISQGQGLKTVWTFGDITISGFTPHPNYSGEADKAEQFARLLVRRLGG